MADRAVSEALSFTLVFAIIVASIALVSVSGLGTLQDVRDAEQVANAEQAFDVLADNVADVYQRGAPSRATEISLGDAQLRTGDNVTITVYVNDSGGNLIRERSWAVRPIIYEGADERRVVYTAGAVFRTNRDGGAVVREPPLIATENRTFVPVVGLNRPAVQSLGGSTVLVRTVHLESTLAYENRSADAAEVRVVVSDTPRADLWATAYSDRGLTCNEINDTATGCAISRTDGIDRVYVVYHDIGVTLDE